MIFLAHRMAPKTTHTKKNSQNTDTPRPLSEKNKSTSAFLDMGPGVTPPVLFLFTRLKRSSSLLFHWPFFTRLNSKTRWLLATQCSNCKKVSRCRRKKKTIQKNYSKSTHTFFTFLNLGFFIEFLFYHDRKSKHQTSIFFSTFCPFI